MNWKRVRVRESVGRHPVCLILFQIADQNLSSKHTHTHTCKKEMDVSCVCNIWSHTHTLSLSISLSLSLSTLPTRGHKSPRQKAGDRGTSKKKFRDIKNHPNSWKMILCSHSVQLFHLLYFLSHFFLFYRNLTWNVIRIRRKKRDIIIIMTPIFAPNYLFWWHSNHQLTHVILSCR